ncbi:MAG TPA: RNA polymerase sigma factor RpoD/SigA [Saprospiraceae bacterium]|nr:RNA polymerase sigma factor RpoD/SigA [Saprospiraceae bacterium]
MKQLKISNRITSRESISLEKYLNDISKIDLLTPEDEADLAQRIRAGDQEALEKMTKANLRFVVSVAKQYQNHGLSLADLINEGNVGLMKAAKRFDETKGFKFISYAVWWIRQSILSAIVEYSRMVRLPLSKVNAYNKVNEAFTSFVQEFEREPTIEELSELLAIPSKEISMMLRGGSKHLSMDAPMTSEEGSSTMMEVFALDDEAGPDIKLMEESLRTEVTEGLSTLSPREIDVVTAYYGLNGHAAMNLEEIGDYYGLTRERVRQIKERALRRLRKSVHRNSLKSYLG